MEKLKGEVTPATPHAADPDARVADYAESEAHAVLKLARLQKAAKPGMSHRVNRAPEDVAMAALGLAKQTRRICARAILHASAGISRLLR
jgi:hypothetical protein